MEKSKNYATVVGKLIDKNIKYDDTATSLFNKEIRGAYVKDNFKEPFIKLLVERHDDTANPDKVTSKAVVDVEIYPIYKTKQDFKTNKIIPNEVFSVIEKLDALPVGEESGALVQVSGSFEENLYGKDNKQIGRFNIFRGRYFETDPSKMKKGGKKQFIDGTVTGVIGKMMPEMETKDGISEETGRLLVDYYYFTTPSKVATANLLNLIVDKDLADDFTEVFKEGDNVKLGIEIRDVVIGGDTSSQKHAFGNRNSDVVSGYVKHEYHIFNGDLLGEADEDYVSEDDFKASMKARDIVIQDKIQKHEEKSTGSHVGHGLDEADFKSVGDSNDNPFD